MRKQSTGLANPVELQQQKGVHIMQTAQKKSLAILEQNCQLLKKLPISLHRHIQLFQSAHVQVDSSINSPHGFSSLSESCEGNAQLFSNNSKDFVDTLAQLKANFTELQNRYLRDKQKDEKKIQSQKNQRENNNISNFALFVSEHTKNSAKSQLKSVCEPIIDEQHLRELSMRVEGMDLE